MHAVDAGDRELLGLPANRHLIDAEAEGHLLLELASSISGTLDLQEVLDKSLTALRRLISFNGGAIQLIEDGHLVAAATDPPMSEEAKTVRIPVGVGISGSIAASGAAEYLPDVLVDERIPEHARRNGISGGVRSYFGVPLIMNGRPIGVLQVDSTRVDDFSARERALVLAFTPTITSAVQNARLFEAERIVAKQLLQADQLKRDFMAVVSHELRTPLTIMLGLSSTLVEFAATLEPDQVREFAARSGGAARRLQRLIDDLLFAAELDRGFLAVQRIPVELEHVIADVAAEHEGSVTPLEVAVAASLPRVTADPDRVHQVLSNIIGNAEKFAPAETPIHMDVAVVDGGVRVTIQDDGPGIPEQHRQAIFDLFFQAEDVNRRTAGGLGIGLYVVKRLCDAMGVAVDLECPESGGTRFDLLFPVVEEPQWAQLPGS